MKRILCCGHERDGTDDRSRELRFDSFRAKILRREKMWNANARVRVFVKPDNTQAPANEGRAASRDENFSAIAKSTISASVPTLGLRNQVAPDTSLL
jgi:hypothetical protein